MVELNSSRIRFCLPLLASKSPPATFHFITLHLLYERLERLTAVALFIMMFSHMCVGSLHGCVVGSCHDCSIRSLMRSTQNSIVCNVSWCVLNCISWVLIVFLTEQQDVGIKTTSR